MSHRVKASPMTCEEQNPMKQASTPRRHREIVEQIGKVLSNRETARKEKAARLAEIIRAHRDYRWVGVYRVEDHEIVAVAWTGDEAPAYPRFPIERGLCGAAVRSGEVVISGDVMRDPRYLTTFGTTRSEMIVPIKRGEPDEAVVGLIDAESDRVNAFGDEDRDFLTCCAQCLAPLWD